MRMEKGKHEKEKEAGIKERKGRGRMGDAAHWEGRELGPPWGVGMGSTLSFLTVGAGGGEEGTQMSQQAPASTGCLD